MKPDLIEEIADKWQAEWMREDLPIEKHPTVADVVKAGIGEYCQRVAKADAPEAKPVAWAHYDCGELMGVLEFETERYNVPLYAKPSGVTVPDEKRGLYNKYHVERLNDTTGKHKDCEYYVLDLKHDKFSLPALTAYHDACIAEFPELAKDLREKISQMKLLRAAAEGE
jgi:hypothetical protein